jgi:peptidyl-prolyl cis-trans isomerase C
VRNRVLLAVGPPWLFSAWLLSAWAFLAWTLPACSSCNDRPLQEASPGDSGPHAATSSLTPEQAAKVLARVGDETITLGDYVAALEHMDQFDRLRYQSGDRRKELLNEMINVRLLADEAHAKGYDKDPIAQQELRAILRDAMLAEAHRNVPAPADIPEAEVRDYYDAHKADYRDPERRRLSLIVLKDDAGAGQVLEQARHASAAEWGALVRSRSIDPGAHANVPVDLAGDVGMVAPPGDPRGENPKVPDEVRAAAFTIPKVGDVLDHVVRSGGKAYLVRFTQKTDAHERALPEAERAIRVKLVEDKIQAKDQELLADLRRRFPVTVDEAAVKSVKVELPDAGGD